MMKRPPAHPRASLPAKLDHSAAGRRVVVLHVFTKKSRRTPRRAFATARERMRQVTP